MTYCSRFIGLTTLSLKDHVQAHFEEYVHLIKNKLQSKLVEKSMSDQEENPLYLF